MTARPRDTVPAPPPSEPGQHSLSARLVALERVAEAARRVVGCTAIDNEVCGTCRMELVKALAEVKS